MLPLYGFALAFGLAIGSFLNVCIYRVPLGKSISFPPSACPSCGARIKPYHNIPVIGYVILGGRCHSCGGRISAMYPAVELLNGLLYVAALYWFGPTVKAVGAMLLLSVMVVVTFIDLEHRIIPDGITLTGIPLGLVLGPLVFGTPFLDSVIGVLAGGGLLLGVGVLGSMALGKEGMGGGDVKLMAMVGAFLGWKMALVSIFIGASLGSFVGVPLILFKVMDRGTMIPFGPFLAVGSAVALFFGDDMLYWYWRGAGW